MTFDNNGNLISLTEANGTTLYTWNTRNQLTGISGPGVTASFVYDGLGRREKKTINGSLTEFLFDGVNPVQETSGAAVLANILPGLGIDEFFTRTDVPAATMRHFLPDALGSVLALTDSAGTVLTEYTYEPFGRTTVTGASNSNPYQYTGRENDGTGLYYYRARYYQPGLQRFISDDPFGFTAGDVNLYAYVGNDPLKHTDPHGLFWGKFIWRVVSGVLQIGPVAIALDILGGSECVGGCPLNQGENQALQRAREEREFQRQLDELRGQVDEMCKILGCSSSIPPVLPPPPPQNTSGRKS